MPNDYDAKIEALQKKLSQVKAKKAKATARLAQAERKRDTRRKILLGAWMQSVMAQDAGARERAMRGLDGFLTEARDRELFDLAAKS